MAVSLQQAGNNALATWLVSQLPGDVSISFSWPSPDMELPGKSISILMAGGAFDTPIERQLIKQVNIDALTATGSWQIRSRRQPIQLDVWARTNPERDDLLARLDIALNAGESPVAAGSDPAGDGLLLNLADGWVESFADFSFDGPTIDDTPESIKRSEYRATISGDVYLMLYVNKISSRQLLINLSESGGMFDKNIT